MVISIIKINLNKYGNIINRITGIYMLTLINKYGNIISRITQVYTY